MLGLYKCWESCCKDGLEKSLLCSQPWHLGSKGIRGAVEGISMPQEARGSAPDLALQGNPQSAEVRVVLLNHFHSPLAMSSVGKAWDLNRVEQGQWAPIMQCGGCPRKGAWIFPTLTCTVNDVGFPTAHIPSLWVGAEIRNLEPG